jgi:ribosomal protein RSM22 (predicted rRNA methylase)
MSDGILESQRKPTIHWRLKMPASQTLREINEDLARKINEETRRNPQSPYAGKFVGIANGKVVVVADDLDELVPRLRQMEPDPAKTFIVEASRDYDKVVEIWEIR